MLSGGDDELKILRLVHKAVQQELYELFADPGFQKKPRKKRSDAGVPRKHRDADQFRASLAAILSSGWVPMIEVAEQLKVRPITLTNLLAFHHLLVPGETAGQCLRRLGHEWFPRLIPEDGET